MATQQMKSQSSISVPGSGWPKRTVNAFDKFATNNSFSLNRPINL